MRRKLTLFPKDHKDRDGNYYCFVEPARWKLEKAGWGLWLPKPNPEKWAPKLISLPNLRSRS